MATVNTIRGPLDTAELGPTLMHEHLVLKSPGIAENWPERYDHEAAIQQTKDKLGRLAERGIRTLVDVTPPDIGRDVRVFEKVQAVSEVNIIACTGVYSVPPLYWWFHSPDELADAFINDIRDGIQGTNIRAAILKVASDQQLFPDPPGVPGLNELCLRAVARAHRATGVPISTHTGPPALGLMQQRVFREEGVDLSRVIIGHVGDTTDMDLLKKLLDAGSYIGMDRFGYEVFLPLQDRVNTVADLCQAGYADRMVLSHDTVCYTHWPLEERLGPMPQFTLISDTVLPALQDRGVEKAQIDQMLVGNPRRIFEQQGSY